MVGRGTTEVLLVLGKKGSTRTFLGGLLKVFMSRRQFCRPDVKHLVIVSMEREGSMSRGGLI